MGFVGGLVSKALPAVGGLAGGALGSVLGPAGTAIGGALGSSLGGSLAGSLGGSGVQSGQGWQPGQAPLIQPVTQGQLTNAYNQNQDVFGQQQNFLNALNAQNGIQNQGQVFKSYADIANGAGPNPALAQLNQATGQNIAAQAALMAGQRGTGANAGLLARQIGQQGAGIQQNAAGQAATLQAQQQLAALGAMGNIAGQQVGQQQSAIGQLGNMGYTNQGQLLNSMQGFNQQLLGSNGQVIAAQAPLAVQAGEQNFKNMAGISDKIGPAMASLFAGDQNNGTTNTQAATDIKYKYDPTTGAQIGGATGQGAGRNMMAAGGMVGPKSKCGQYLMASKGMMVPGRAAYGGDNLKNDTVPALLSPGEIVIPRSVVKSDDPVSKSAAFVQAVLAKNGMRK